MPSRFRKDAPCETDSSPFSAVSDGLAFSNLLPAAIAFALAWISSHTLSAPTPTTWSALAASGAFVVYGVDRLRDVVPDRLTSPRRTQFIERNLRTFRAAIGLAAGILGTCMISAPLCVIGLCATVGTIGLLHRRLKRFAALKTLYVSIAWTAICVGIPWITARVGEEPTPACWLAAILFSAFVANLIASNLRDDEAQSPWNARIRPLMLARAAAALGLALAILAPSELHSLAFIPLAELLALAFYRPTETYGHLAVDGALLLGALPALVLLTSQPTGA